MQKYSFILATWCLFLILCGCEGRKGQGEDVLPASRMADILTVIYISEVKAIQRYDLKMQKNDYFKNHLYPAILDSMQVDDSLFYYSYDHYERRPAELEAIMDSVIARLERMEADTVSNAPRTVQEAYEEIRAVNKLKNKEAQQTYDDR